MYSLEIQDSYVHKYRLSFEKGKKGLIKILLSLITEEF